MRLFTKKENTLIKALVEYKQTGRLDSLQISRILRDKLSFFALTWQLKPIPRVDVYTRSDYIKPSLYAEIRNNYFNILDLVYFILELEQRNFVKLIELTSVNEMKQMLFDESNYSYKNSMFINNKVDGKSLEFFKDFHNVIVDSTNNGAFLQDLNINQLPNSFAKDLNRVAHCLIYPLPIAEEYVREGFYTLEDRRFIEKKKLNASTLLTTNDALRVSKDSYKTSANSYKIAACALMVSILFGLLQCCGDLSIEETQFQKLIECINNVKTTTVH